VASVIPVLGQTLGPYRLIKGIALGGLSAVFRAIDERSQRQVAIKVPLEGALADSPARERLRREAFALERLDHPSTPTFLDLGSQDGIDFLALEYVEGRTLRDLLRKSGPTEEAALLALGLQIAAALGEIHRRGVIHCDLKPSNVVLTPDGAVRLLDFGHARIVGEDCRKDTGTLPYMAPERLQGRPSDARGDLWSLGVLLFEMATGQRPFRGATSEETTAAIREGCLIAPSCRRSGLSDRFDRIVLRALEKDPERRYASAVDMCRDLRRD
jgi:serine/threonine-protein kinase